MKEEQTPPPAVRNDAAADSEPDDKINAPIEDDIEVDGDTLRQMLAAANAIYEALHSDNQQHEKAAIDADTAPPVAISTAAASWRQYVKRNITRLAGRIGEKDEAQAIESLIRDGSYSDIVQAVSTIRKFGHFVGNRAAAARFLQTNSYNGKHVESDNNNITHSDDSSPVEPTTNPAVELVPALFSHEYKGCTFRSAEVEAAVASSLLTKVLAHIKSHATTATFGDVDEEIIYLLARILNASGRLAVAKAVIHELKKDNGTADFKSVGFFLQTLIRFRNNHVIGYLTLQTNIEQLLEGVLKRLVVVQQSEIQLSQQEQQQQQQHQLTVQLFSAASELVMCSLTASISILYGCVGKAIMITHFCHEFRHYSPATLLLAFFHRQSVPYRPDFEYEFPSDIKKAEELLSNAVEMLAQEGATITTTTATITVVSSTADVNSTTASSLIKKTKKQQQQYEQQQIQLQLQQQIQQQHESLLLYWKGVLHFKGLDSFLEEQTDVFGNRIVEFSAAELESFAQAVEYFNKSSLLGCAAAQCSLGFCFEIGRGVAADVAKALHFYRLAAAQGHPDAQCCVGDYYAFGKCSSSSNSSSIGDSSAVAATAAVEENDYEQAVMWYSRASQQGFCEAQNNLAVCYQHGRGVPQNEEIAMKYFHKAAEQGSAVLQYNLGTRYQYGTGIVTGSNSYVTGSINGVTTTASVATATATAANITEAIRWYMRAAEQHHGGALHALAHIYHNGIGVKPDAPRAVEYYRLSALAGYGPAEYKFGACYATGVGVSKDPEEAVRWYRKAAAKGQNDAMNSLGVCYASGSGVEKSNESAVYWVRKAADQGYGNAQYNLAAWYSKGNLIAQDHHEAAVLFRKAAAQGIAAAQYSAGMYCKNGLGGPKDDVAAAAYFQMAAEQNEPLAQVQLAICCMQGRGVEKDPARGVYWYRKAAERGNAKAQCYLGYYYSLGKGVDKDEAQSAAWYRKAADQGYAEAQNLLAVCYKNGAGVDKDELRAASWMRRAAEQGNVNAQYNMGYWYAIGFGVQENQERAVAWYRHAAQQGHANAQLALGARYELGNGVPQQDLEQAAAWYRLASAQGSHEAQQRLDEMDSNKSWFFW